MDDVVRQILENEHGLKIGRRIGRGGFGEVYEAQSDGDVPCAVKVSLDRLDASNPAVAKEFENLKLVRAVTGHPNLVTVMDVWLIGGYLVTRWELSQEGSLQDLLRRYQEDGKAGISVKRALQYCFDAAEAIDFLNDQGIYHRDIKPQNLLLFHGRVKVADLGLAKFAGASTVSHTGSGTLGYLPPEAYDKHRLTKTVDLYSLAATYIKLRTGREPFGDNPMEVFQRQTGGDPIVEGLLPGEAEWVRRALDPKPEDRPQGGAKAWVRAVYEALRSGRHPPKDEDREASFGETSQEPELILPTPAHDPEDHPQDNVVECTIVATHEDLQRSSPNRGADDASSHRQFVMPKAGEPQQIVVDRKGGGQARTLEEALAACEEGATIVLAAGTHRLDRPLEIVKSVRLVGEGMEQTRVGCDGEGFVLQFRGDGSFSAEGISFEHFGDPPANVVEIKSGKANLSGCRFRGGVDQGDSRTAGTGLWIHRSAEVRVVGCQAVQNQRRGIAIGGTATATLEENLCENNQKGGIGWFDLASGTARNNVCRLNGLQGIDVQRSAAPTLEGNVCEQNEDCGILYSGHASGAARNNRCGHNGVHGIGVQGFAAPTLVANACKQNTGCGIYYCEKGSGTARKNLCRHNRQHGIGVAGLAAPTLEQNRCEENSLYGIFYSEKAFGTARDNVVRSNKAGGILVRDSARPKLERNTRLLLRLDYALLGAIFAIFGTIAGAIGGAFVGAFVGAIFGTIAGAIDGASAGGDEGIVGAIGGAFVGAFVGAIVGAIVGVNKVKKERTGKGGKSS